MNRRDFLFSTSSLLIAPSAVLAQERPKPVAADIIFADFESGTYDGWTLTGNCWTPTPPSELTFPGVITGFQGKFYMGTYHPKLGVAATGKAVSKEFIIEKPFINFLIGGGYYPSEACMNLVVDGKVVRTRSGNHSRSLVEAIWDVSKLIGHKAHIEVVDITYAADRGYIMVDDICFSATPLDKTLFDIESGPHLHQFGIHDRYFMKHSVVPFSQKYGNGDLSPLFDFDVTPAVFKELIDACCVRGYRLPHNPDRKIDETAHTLSSLATTQIGMSGIVNPKPLLQQWLCAEAICAFVYSNMEYDWPRLRDNPDQVFPRQETPLRLYEMKQPLLICSGYGYITTMLATAAGLKCCNMNGVKRNWDGPVVHDDGHSWVMFEFEGGIRVPADTCPMYPEEGLHPKVASASCHSKVNWRTLPCTPRTWEMFMREYWPHVVRWTQDVYQHNPNQGVNLTDLDWDKWLAVNSKPYWDLEHWYVHEYYEKNRLA